METDFKILTSSHIAQLMTFRGLYLGAMERLKSRRLGRVNIVELVVLLTRGGRRVPLWLRTLDSNEANVEFPLQELNELEVHKYFENLCFQLRIHRVVPRTKHRLFASYLSGQVCATAASLTAFAGISKSTAHKWLYRCVEFKLLNVFETGHEIFYIQPALVQLVIVGTTEPKHVFRYDFDEDLADLRRRSAFWLQRSKLVQRFEKDLRTYGG